MAKRPKKPTRALRVLALALMSSFALIAASASSAGAVVIKPTEGLPAEFTASGSGFYSSDQMFVECTGETTGSGVFYEDAWGTVTLAFHGCRRHIIGGGTGPCNSSGAEEEEIVTAALNAELAPLTEEEPGVVLLPIGTDNFAEFNCGAAIVGKWEGGLIGEITAPGYEEPDTALTVDFESVETYVQKHKKTLEGFETHLTSYVNGGTGAEMALTGSVDLKLDEDEFELSSAEPSDNGHPDMLFPGGFPAEFALQAHGPTGATLKFGETVIECNTEEEIPSFGSAKFTDPSSGEANLSLFECTETAFGSKCKTEGESAGVISTEAFPTRLVYLSDGEPGIAFETTGAIPKIKCFGGFIVITVTGNGVLGAIESPEVGKSSGFITFGFNETEEGTQEYTETENEEKFGLEASSNGGEKQPLRLDYGAFNLNEGAFLHQ